MSDRKDSSILMKRIKSPRMSSSLVPYLAEKLISTHQQRRREVYSILPVPPIPPPLALQPTVLLQLLEKIATHYYDVYNDAPSQFQPSEPIWSNMTSINVINKQRDDWRLSSTINQTLVLDPTVQSPGSDLNKSSQRPHTSAKENLVRIQSPDPAFRFG